MLPTLAIFGLGVPELLIILAVVLLLFGGSRLAGLGKSTGRALKEFKEETKSLKDEKAEQAQVAGAETPIPPQAHQQPPDHRQAPQLHQSPSYEQPPTHQQPATHQQPPVQPQVYQQPPVTPSQNQDGSEIRKDG